MQTTEALEVKSVGEADVGALCRGLAVFESDSPLYCSRTECSRIQRSASLKASFRI
jgi:hypothetical protein